MSFSIINETTSETRHKMYSGTKTKVGLVQINNSFHNQNYLPLAVGFLQSYAMSNVKNIDDFDFMLPVYKRIHVDQAVKQLINTDIVAFSVYVWNFNISNQIAHKIKEAKPNTLIIFGGCHVPEHNTEEFLRKYTHVDIACTGEGEQVFASLLQNYHKRNWQAVPSINFIDGYDNYISTVSCPRIEDLNEIPSPFLTGIFDPLIRANPNENWIGLWETNRGCPFKCAFCDWGVGAKKRMSDYDLSRLYDEIDWFSKHRVEFIYCCDANFGMYKDRDLSIAKKFAYNKDKYGYPHVFSVQNTKNSTEASYNIQKVLAQKKLSKGVLLAFQSLHKPTLKAIKRDNIKLETFFELQKRFTSDGVETFSDIILGLPEETYETFTDGVSVLMGMGQHNRMQFNNLSVLPNAEMGSEEYQKKYGLELIESKMINIHGSLGESIDDIYETQQLVVSTNSMPSADWRKVRAFAYMASLLHFDKLLQVPIIIVNSQYSISYKDIIDSFVHSTSPILSYIKDFFIEKARDIQNGGPEYCESNKWLGIWWPADEYILIELATTGKLNDFYAEAECLINEIIYRFGYGEYESIVADSISLNKALLKLPFQTESITINHSHNIWEVYKNHLIGEKYAAKRGKYKCLINRNESWNSWEEWAQKVVWYGNKRGAYLYECKII